MNRRSFLKQVIFLGAAGFLTYLSGCLGQKPSLELQEKPIRIGQLTELTGGLAVYGYSNDATAKAAVNLINETGGIAGRPVQYVVEDTATNPTVGIRKMRRLIELHKVDFIIGSQHSGIAIGCNPLAKEFKTLHFPLGEATSITEKDGNRYVFRINNNVREQVKAGIKFAVEELAKKWVTVVLDYSWGWSNEEEFKKYAEQAGAKVLLSIRTPIGTKDYLPYLSKIPEEAEAVFFANWFSDFINFIRDLHTLRPDIIKYGPVCCIEGVNLEPLADQVEDAWFLTWLPRNLEGYDTEFHRMFREKVGIDEEGREIGDPSKIYTVSHCWAVWEAIFAIKEAIEQCGWESKEDNPELIQALEGMEFKESLSHPQGDKFLRAEDHQAFMQHFVDHVENGKLVTKKIISIDESIYPAQVDYTKEGF